MCESSERYNNTDSDLTEQLSLFRESFIQSRDVKKQIEKIRSDKEFRFYKNYCIDTEFLNSFEQIDSQIEALLIEQQKKAQKICDFVEAYEDYKKLCKMNEILSSEGGKIALLLDMTGNEIAREVLSLLLGDVAPHCNSDDIITFYYNSVSRLANISKSKKNVWDHFYLSQLDEEPPKDLKEKNKRTIRNNTIIHHYKKYGSRMFEPEIYAELENNLKKVGIEMPSEIQIKGIIARRNGIQ